MEQSLESLREDINKTDEQIVELFRHRMSVSSSVAEYKRAHGLPVLDAARERALLSKISELAGEEFDIYARTLYNTMLDVSRAYQYSKLNPCSEMYGSIEKALKDTPKVFPSRARVACQGVEGAYSQIAAEKFFELPEISYYPSFDSVFAAIENGECRYGVLPIENSTAGSVKKVYELMIKHSFNIVKSHRLKVSHNLLAKPGVKISEITEIFSHEQAINQCSDFLKSLSGVKVTVCANTAMAAKSVAESEDKNVAALSSGSCAELYGLDILASSVQDNDNNFTRFICISKDREIYPGADRISLMMVIKNRPGELYRLLSCFNSLGIDMTKLESCPIPERDFEFMFYFDFILSVYSPKLRQLLCELEARGERFRLMGAYCETV